MTDFAIRTGNLWKNFGSTQVLRGITLDIPAGTVVGLLGANGAGKSTLIKCLVGLLRPTMGNSELLGDDSLHLSAEVKERLGYVPQDIRLYSWMTVEQIIQYTSAYYPKWDAKLMDKLINNWDIPRTHRIGPLSPGQLQKLGLLLAMGPRPDLLILDEPVAALDPLARREFLRSLLEFAQEENKTILFSTHITSDLERVASHVVMLKAGEVSLFEELDALKDRVKRIRIAGEWEFTADFEVPQALHTEVSGKIALATVVGADDALLSLLRQKWNATVSVEDLNLEEIFVEMNSRLTPVA
ncbi:MAG: ABC transporter ATP-binding protein [Planctomycetota bacterium]|nr:ABC transporter ATP-binding protein [Planctomycetota bacterium]MDA1211106.1 ABC transporter ATP-binding protein [Planctomycetota bacterium]